MTVRVADKRLSKKSYRNPAQRFITLIMQRLRYSLHGWSAKPTRALNEAILHGTFEEGESEHFRHLSFTFALIALSAKIACADGELTQEKYIAFRESFPLRSGVCAKIRSLFALACANETPPEQYVTQIKYMFPQQPELFISLVERLFRIASADGAISRAQERLLAQVAHRLDVSPSEYSRISASYSQPNRKPAHEIMGVKRSVQAGPLKRRYRELMRRYHPDRFAGQDMSPEVRILLQLKASEINTAYKILAKKAA